MPTLQPPVPAASAPLDAAWQTLRAVLEWDEQFSLTFVFNGNSRLKAKLFARASDFLAARAKGLQRPAIADPLDFVEVLLPSILDPNSALSRHRFPLWLDLDAFPGSDPWDAGRRQLLARLNERRAALTKSFSRPMILVFSDQWPKQVAEAAPDLWTIRQPSVFLQPAAGPIAASITEERPGVGRARLGIAVLVVPPATGRWRAAYDGDRHGISVWDGIDASQAALDSGFLGMAATVARETVDLAETQGDLRERSIAYGNLANVLQDLGRLDEALAAARESEALRRRLIDEFGENPQRLRDLSVSLNRLGDLHRALGRLDEALDTARESETLRRRLIDQFGENPEHLRDLAIALEKRGQLALALSRTDEALAAFSEARFLAQRLIANFGEAVRFLEIAADAALNHGQTLAPLEQTGDALAAARDAQALYERLALTRPDEGRYATGIEMAQSLIQQLSTPPEP